MKRMIGPRRQKGFALWLLLAAFLLGGFALFATLRPVFSRYAQEQTQAMTLRRAADALIARAVSDDNRPGSLPCPDLITNSAGWNNYPDDGKADMFTLTRCPSYIGFLPWLTLDLPELQDASGNHLWYALATALRDDDSAQPINSDSSMGLKVDTDDDIAAIVFAPGQALAGQSRPAQLPSAYLDGENGNGDDQKYITGPPGEQFNDQLLVITRRELMAAVEKRVVNTVRNCLEQHADATSNSTPRYPWPAPLGEENGNARSGTLFGRIPLSQPGNGPSAMLAAGIDRLGQIRTQLAQSGTANEQLIALQALDNAILPLRNLFESMYLDLSLLKQSADEIRGRLEKSTATIDDAVANNRISRNEGIAIRQQNDSNQAILARLPELLGQTGLDVLPAELARRNTFLAAATSTTELAASALAISELLLATTTMRSDIAPALGAASNAAQALQRAAAAAAGSGDTSQQAAARAAAAELQAQITVLQNRITASRANRLASEMTELADMLDMLRGSLQTQASQENRTNLYTGLATADRAIDGLETGMDSILAGKAAALAALASAIQTLQKPIPDDRANEEQSRLASEKIRTLATALGENEAVDNNLTRSSVQASLSAFQNAASSFAQVDTATPRPLQSDIVPYAAALGSTAVNLGFWAEIIASHAATSAPLAKAMALTAGSAPSQAEALESSAYAAASAALTGISGKKGALELVQTYMNNPGSTTRTNADKALANVSKLLDTLIEVSQALRDATPGTTASAQTMIWASRSCDFLLPAQNGWWAQNQWAKTLFYQIGNPLKTAPGTLEINGQGKYRLVVIAAGRSLSGQNRSLASSAAFLEGKNADPSRDGEARTPSPFFSSRPPSPDFNDRLSY